MSLPVMDTICWFWSGIMATKIVSAGVAARIFGFGQR
jgi:hypothetical protein